nr:hypothetical protein [Tanacetum cinerariifolium]
MASTIIYLATNKKFNFSKYIFDNMVKNLEGEVKFLTFPRVLALKTTKTNQALEIISLKRKVKKLEKKANKRTHKLNKLYKIGSSRRIKSSDEASLSDQEDASKQGRKIIDIDADVEVTLIEETQGRSHGNLMFDTLVLDEQEVEVEKVVSTTEVTTASATTTTIDELTLAQTLIEIKAAKPKAVTTAATITTNDVTRSKARGVIVQEPTEFTTTTSPLQPSQLPQAKDKGKAKIVEPEKPLKKKDQIMIDEEVASNLEAQLQAGLEEEERLARQKEEEANIALIASWDNVQAMIDADYQMATQMQAKEQEALSIEENSKLFVQLLKDKKETLCSIKSKRKEEQATNYSSKEKYNVYLSKKHG